MQPVAGRARNPPRGSKCFLEYFCLGIANRGTKSRSKPRRRLSYLPWSPSSRGTKKSYHYFEMSPFTKGLKFAFAAAAAARRFSSHARKKPPLHQKYLSEPPPPPKHSSKSCSRRRRAVERIIKSRFGADSQPDGRSPHSLPTKLRQRSSDTAAAVCTRSHCKILFFCIFLPSLPSLTRSLTSEPN